VTTLVLDASVAAKWVLPAEAEPLADRAMSLLERYAEDGLRFVLPDVFWAEFGNILWKAARQGRISAESAVVAIEGMRERAWPTVSSLRLLPEAFQIANSFGRSVYDGIYVAVAIEVNAEFVTADERLANALAARLPVKWLGAW
jgi:predicted nucleic acid-binding protein